jgi:hypothetical protein
MSETHAERRWEVMTNRHPNCDGTEWGWIEGAPGNVCWSNTYGSAFTRADAERVAREHNAALLSRAGQAQEER